MIIRLLAFAMFIKNWLLIATWILFPNNNTLSVFAFFAAVELHFEIYIITTYDTT